MVAGRPQKLPVHLSQEEITRCKEIASSHACATLKTRSAVLLGLNNCKPGKLNSGQVAAAHCVNKDFTTRVSKLYAEGGIDGVLRIERNPASDVARLKLDAWTESQLIAMACTPPPSPFKRWTVKLCTNEINARLEANFSRSTVWRALQRNKLRPHLSEYWCIPEITEQFILRMERVLHVYSLPYDSDYPVVCMDEVALQLLGDVKQRLEVAPGLTEKQDYEYKRLGTRNVFVFVEPKTGRYYVRATETRTANDWAYEMKILAMDLYPNAKKIILISDNLNVHTVESLYKAFPPEMARQIARRIDFVHTPKHASWLNMAECAINVLKTECLGKRLRTEEEVAELPAKIEEWLKIKNDEQKAFSLTFTPEIARSERQHWYEPLGELESSSGKYEQENSLCVCTPRQLEVRTNLVTACKEEDNRNIIDLFRCVDEDGNVYYAATLEENRVVLQGAVSKREIVPVLKQRNTQDGWPIPLPKNERRSKKNGSEEEKELKRVYDFNFMALGEDIVEVYNSQYDEKYPVVCIRKRPLNIENLSENAWVGNLHNEVEAIQKKKEAEPETIEEAAEQNPLEQEEKDERLGLTFVINPYTGEKLSRISDWNDGLSWAETFQDIVNKMYPEAEKIRVIVCSEDIEKMSTLERVCAPEEALRIALKLDVHAVPANGRWLNLAENEAIMVCRQCLKDGVSSVKQVVDHLVSWQKKQIFVDFKLTLDGFRKAFSRIYPETNPRSP